MGLSYCFCDKSEVKECAKIQTDNELPGWSYHMPREGSESRVRNNGGMIISKGVKKNKLKEKPNSLSFYPPHFLYEVTDD